MPRQETRRLDLEFILRTYFVDMIPFMTIYMVESTCGTLFG